MDWFHKENSYNDTFLKATFSSPRKGTALVQPGVGVRINYLDYWCEAMRDPTVEFTQVKVRYNLFDVSSGYAYIDGRWRSRTPQTQPGLPHADLHLQDEAQFAFHPTLTCVWSRIGRRGQRLVEAPGNNRKVYGLVS